VRAQDVPERGRELGGRPPDARLEGIQEAGVRLLLKAGGYRLGKAGGHVPTEKGTLLSARTHRGRCLPKNKAGVRWRPFDQGEDRRFPMPSLPPLVSQPVKRVESDGLVGRAGDGTRTRDSLLGRQTFPRSTRYAPESALQADPGVFIVNRAAKTYTVPRKFGDAEHRRSLS
jgi:hypothetical protein